MDAVEDCLENCAQVKVDIEVAESLLKRENLDVSLRYVLKHSMRGGSNIFQLFDTSEKPKHIVASRRRWLESQGKTVHGKRVGKTSGAPTGPYKRRCRSKVRRQPEKKKAAGS